MTSKPKTHLKMQSCNRHKKWCFLLVKHSKIKSWVCNLYSYPSVMGASPTLQVSSCLGLHENAAIDTLPMQGSVAELSSEVVVVLRSRIYDVCIFTIGPICQGYVPFHSEGELMLQLAFVRQRSKYRHISKNMLNQTRIC